MVKFSIIVPLYNKELAIKETIQSIIKQKYTEFELIIIDDGSKDASAEIVNSIQDKRIRYYYKNNGGVSSARNEGMNLARNEWIVFFDADDLMSDDCLSILSQMIVNYPGYKVYCGNMELYGGLRCKEFETLAKISDNPFRSWFKMELAPEMGCFSFNKSIIDKIQPFDERMSCFEDLCFTSQLMEKYAFVYTSKVLKKYRKEFSTLSVVCQPIEKEYAYYMTKESVRGNFWKEMVLAYNVWDTKRHRIEFGDKAGELYYKQKLELFSFPVRFYIGLMSLKRSFCQNIKKMLK